MCSICMYVCVCYLYVYLNGICYLYVCMYVCIYVWVPPTVSKDFLRRASSHIIKCACPDASMSVFAMRTT